MQLYTILFLYHIIITIKLKFDYYFILAELNAYQNVAILLFFYFNY